MRRRIYFISGFDPRGASFYYKLLGEQIRCHGIRCNRPLRLERRRSDRDPLLSRWWVCAEASPDPGVELSFLHWDDIARGSWPRHPLHLIGAAAGMGWWYLFGGGLVRVARLCPRVALCGAYPLIVAAVAGFIAWSAGLAVASTVASLGLPVALARLLGVAVLLALLLAAWRLADRGGVTWLVRTIRFTHRLGHSREGALLRRVEDLAAGILRLEDAHPADEVWLVGHSCGSFVMAMLAAALRRSGGALGPSARSSSVSDPPQPIGQPLLRRLRLLSLGQNLANLAIYPGATRFRSDLLALAREPRLPWLDVTSRDDFLCFAGVDPYRSCGLKPPVDAASYPALRLIDLAGRRGLGRGWRRGWGVASQQFDLHFDYLRTAPANGTPPAPSDTGSNTFDLWWELLPLDPSPLTPAP